MEVPFLAAIDIACLEPKWFWFDMIVLIQEFAPPGLGIKLHIHMRCLDASVMQFLAKYSSLQVMKLLCSQMQVTMTFSLYTSTVEREKILWYENG